MENKFLTVKELREQLAQLPDDCFIITEDYESGVDTFESTELVDVEFGSTVFYGGDLIEDYVWDIVTPTNPPKYGGKVIKAVLLK